MNVFYLLFQLSYTVNNSGPVFLRKQSSFLLFYDAVFVLNLLTTVSSFVGVFFNFNKKIPTLKTNK